MRHFAASAAVVATQFEEPIQHEVVYGDINNERCSVTITAPQQVHDTLMDVKD